MLLPDLIGLFVTPIDRLGLRVLGERLDRQAVETHVERLRLQTEWARIG